jgi:hypothetical protein
MSAGDDNTGDDTKCVDRNPSPALLHTHAAPVVAGNPSNQGQGCVAANCHATPVGAGASEYQFAGTLYKTDGSTAQAGATIRIKSMSGTIVSAVTDTGGNFYFPANSLADPIGAQTQATVCPQLTPMQSSLQAGGGNCNGGGTCHGQGGQQPLTLSDTL